MNNQIVTNSSESPDFTLAFQQMASFVAIAKTRVSSEVLDELIQQCFVILPQEPFATSADISGAIHTLFGIKLAEKDVSPSVKRLLAKGNLVTLPGNQIGLAATVRQNLDLRVADAKRLEDEVRATWLTQVSGRHAELNTEKLWHVLKAYLAQAFRRHGIQAVALLDPTVAVAKEQLGSLSSILNSVIQQDFVEEQRNGAREAVSTFFSTVGSDRRRGEYIAQLADGAFNYFSLTVAPEVSERLRGKLNPLTLFLDTNFLFGILNLHVNPQVDVSAELVHAVRQFRLPFKLRYHDATVREMSNTLSYYGSALKKHPQWPQSISRAVVRSDTLSGIELRYHQKNSEQRVDVDDFLSPYKHWDILLKDKDIDIYRVDSSQQRLQARADLEVDYKEFLTKVRREKPYEAIQHDMAVLETARSLQSNARSTLDSGAILVTCDYYLYRFDWESSRAADKQSCTVLPSLLWQILRPFVSDSQQFDQAFAETFALPVFSLTRGGAAKAASRMVSILASYRDIPEETAAKMLANDLLLAELQTTKTDAEFAATVESAMVEENVVLVEEKAALAKQLATEKVEREHQLSVTAQILQEKENSLQQKEQALRDTAGQVLKEREEKEKAEARSNQYLQKSTSAEQQALCTAKVASIVVALLIIVLFELTIRYVVHWDWLLNHSNSFGLQGCIALMTFSGILGAGVKPWRNLMWGVVFFGVLFAALPILGGPAKVP